MYQNCCKKCGSTSLHTEVKSNNTGLYCDDCGAWQRWLGKDELRAFEHSQKSQLPKVCNKKVYKLNYANQKLKSKYCPNCGAIMDEKKES